MYLLLLLGFLQFSASADSNLVQQSQAQANHYIQNIDQERNIEENLWALTVLVSEHPKIKESVEQSVQKGDKSNEVLKLFESIEPTYSQQLEKIVFKTGSNKLFIDLLLVTEKDRTTLYQQFTSSFSWEGGQASFNYELLAQNIIKDETIGDDIIQNESFSLPHLFLLYRAHKQLKDSYTSRILDNWSSRGNSSNTLYSALYHASYLRALYLKYDYSKTTDIFNPLLSDSLFPNSNLKLKLYQYLDYSMYRLGYYDRSLKIVRQHSLPLTNYLEKEEERIQTRQLQGVYLYSIGKIKKAKEIYEQVLNDVIKNNINISKSSLYNNLALAYYRLGNYDKYLDLQLQALETAKKNNNYSHQLSVFNNLFIFYRSNKDFDNALRYLNKAEDLAQEKNKREQLGKIFTLYGSFYAKFKKNYKQAHNYFAKAKEILNSKSNAKYYIDLLKDQADTYEEQNLFLEALKKHNQIIKLTPDQNSPNYIDAIVNKSLVNIKTGDLNTANKNIRKFKSLNLNTLEFQQIIKAKTVEAEYLTETGSKNKALKILEPALNQVVVRAQGSTDLKSGFWHVEDEYLDAFELAASIYIATNKPGKAVEKLDQLKTINDASLYQNPLVKSSLLNESELTEYKQLTNQLDAVRKKLLTASEGQQFQLRQQINQLNTKKRKYDRKLTKNIDLNPTSIRDVQNKLSAKELLFHITELNDQFYIAKISRSDVTLDTITLNNELRDLFTSTVEQISTGETDLISLHKISSLLELQEIPDRIEQITLVPDSYFYQLPLDILPLESPSTSYSYGEVTYAIEKFNTQYLTTLEEFTNPNTSSPSQNPINYTGYGISDFSNYRNPSLVPLPYAQSEVNQIATKLTHLSQNETYINEQSTKSTFQQTAPNSQIIHLATHSEVSDRDPMFSTVYFSKNHAGQDSTFDDRIFAYELFELDLSNEMIMLNSCESGSGSYIQGTGVMGISRALQYAGARSLVLNLWSVNDMLASDFAVHFYSQLNEGKSKAEALRDTKQYFLNTKNADPHFWGPYMLIGNTDPIVKPQQNANLAMAGAFIFYFLFMIGLSFLTQRGIIFSRGK
ncbi:CHAT domain-containing tetratricopeptide repeat protein [Fodinibius sp. Rm-B-1B1-1]|uniref:CHAT domain-containing protein n=1 Tax=Fodinibius alkaliphilus TaxID=3140241 RepID=UPI00315A2153